MRKIYFSFLFSLFLYISHSSAQYSWKQRANFGGAARDGAFGFSIDSLGYIGGGYNGNNFTDFWQYHPSTNSWTQKSNVPIGVRAASTFVIDSGGYLIGGIPDSGPFNTNLYMYDAPSNTWTSKAAFPGVPIYGAAAFSIGTKGYFGVGNGGSADGPYYAEFYEYDATTDSWTQKATFPGLLRFGTYGISLNGEGYLGLGGDAGLGVSYTDWWQYDPGTDSWTSKASYPSTGRGYPSGFTINNLIYVGGGDYYAVSPLKDFYEYNPTSDVWTKKEDYGGGVRTVGVGFSIGNIGYFGTGFDFTNYYNDFWEYSPDEIPPVASFQSSDSSICTNDCISFTDHSANATSWLWFFPGATPYLSSSENPQNICYSAAGSYDVLLIVSNSAGNDTLYMSKYITVNTSPPAPDIKQAGDTLFCSTDSAYTSYQWYYSNVVIPGATDTFFVAYYNGNYNVKVINGNGCSVAVGINVILGLNEVESNPSFSLYPNPAGNELTISISNAFHKAEIEIDDATGRNFIKRTFDSVKDDKINIDLANLEKGAYFVLINIDGNRYSKKILKLN